MASDKRTTINARVSEKQGPCVSACKAAALGFRDSETWQSDADAQGEIGRSVGSFRGDVDERARFQISERQACGQRTALEQPLVAFAIEQDAPVPRGRCAVSRCVRMLVVQLVVAALYQRGCTWSLFSAMM